MANIQRSNSSQDRAPTTRATSTNGPSFLPNLQAILNEPALGIERMKVYVFLGVEKNQCFRIFLPDGRDVGYVEKLYDGVPGSAQWQTANLPSTWLLNDTWGNHLLTITRPLLGFTSRTMCYTPDNTRIGESKQNWHLWRRRYKLYLAGPENNAELIQFGRINAPRRSSEFPIENLQHQAVGSIDKNWAGFAHELVTDTGVYFVRFKPPIISPDQESLVNPRRLSLAEKAVMLATAISIDFDYFSPETSSYKECERIVVTTRKGFQKAMN